MAASSDSNAASPYPIRDVWDAITNPARLADWWLPFDADITVDLREGGQMVFAADRRRTDDDDVHDPARRAADAARAHPRRSPARTCGGSSSRSTTGCVLRLSHFVTDAGAAIDNCYVVGLHTSLARLVPCLAGRPVAWDWDGFAEAQAHYAGVGLAPPVDAS